MSAADARHLELTRQDMALGDALRSAELALAHLPDSFLIPEAATYMADADADLRQIITRLRAARAVMGAAVEDAKGAP